MAKWRTPKHYNRALQKKGDAYSYKGIKRPPVFRKLKLHVCDPSLPSCIGHDLFIGGVVDVDLASIIRYFVKDKKWFKYKLINKRIMALKCRANDAGNKPAKIHLKGKKLGGHAVQNWCLLRLLPFLIGDKIQDTADPIWKLYLQLKSICELVCAPALTKTQIATMRGMLVDYLEMRKPLRNRYKPKHHYFQHLADLWERFGPMIFMWTLGFEQYHQFFKRVSRVCNNYINLLFTFASRHQLVQAYESTGVLFPSEASYNHAYPLLPESESAAIHAFIQEKCTFSQDALVIEKLSYNEIDYKADQYLLFGGDNLSDMYVGKIKLIIHDACNYYVIVSKYKTVMWEEYGIHRIVKRDAVISMVKVDNLENPCPHGVYEFQGKKCISLKNVLLPSQQ